jgi:lipopolysaccharide export system protein LptC
VHFYNQPPAEIEKNRSPSNTLTHGQTRSFNTQGTLHYTVEASTTEHFRANPTHNSKLDHTNLSAPRISLFQAPNTAPWHITAEHGEITDGGETITLWGNTKVWQINENQQKSELISERLVVKPERQYVETDKAVMLTTTGSKTRAIGMRAHLQQDKIELLSSVRGTHELN